MSEYVIIHELAHVYSLSTDVGYDQGPMGIAFAYFGQLGLTGRYGCRGSELLADIMTMSVLGNGHYYGYWRNCHGSRKNRSEALGLVENVLDGEAPAWFNTHYSTADGTLDLPRFFRDATLNVGYSTQWGPQWYRLRNMFGGYCEGGYSESWRGLDARINPWRDGGCHAGAPENLAVSAIESGKLQVAWQWPANVGSSPG